MYNTDDLFSSIHDYQADWEEPFDVDLKALPNHSLILYKVPIVRWLMVTWKAKLR